jgi:hypothetical protein
MKDFAGRELEVGQTVALCLPYYKHLVKGRVEKIGNKMVSCSYTGPWGEDTTARYPNQVVILDNQGLNLEFYKTEEGAL